MNVTATLFAQMITFIILVIFVQKYLWGPMLTMMDQRAKKISDGLAAAEHGKHEEELAEKKAKKILKDAHSKADEIIAHAEKRGSDIEDTAKNTAKDESKRIVDGAQSEIEQQISQAKESLRVKVSELAIAGAEKILSKEVDKKQHEDMLNNLAGNL